MSSNQLIKLKMGNQSVEFAGRVSRIRKYLQTIWCAMNLKEKEVTLHKINLWWESSQEIIILDTYQIREIDQVRLE